MIVLEIHLATLAAEILREVIGESVPHCRNSVCALLQFDDRGGSGRGK